jgi:hypothetical protein
VYLDQVVLQYWFHGPLDGTTDAGSNGTGSAGGDSVIAQVSASQFRLTCSDATPEIGECYIDADGAGTKAFYTCGCA